MKKLPAKLPVKTRLPIQAWIFAGVVTLFSLTSSLMHFNVPTGAVYAGVSYMQPLSLAILGIDHRSVDDVIAAVDIERLISTNK